MAINETLTQAFAEFVSEVPARRLKRNVRKMLFEFLELNYAVGLPTFTKELLVDLDHLLELLDTIDHETDQSALL
jgi:hypothetical protein